MFELKVSSTTKIPIKLINSSDSVTPLTGVSSPTVYYSKNGGASTLWGSPTWSELSSSNMPGVYLLTPTTTQTNTAGPLVINVTVAGAIPATIVVNVVDSLTSEVPFDVWNTQTSGAYGAGTFGRSLLVARKLLTNRTQDFGTYIVVYDDNGTNVLGRFNWEDATGTRATLSGTATPPV